jgi:hypothetical protein
MKRTKWTQSDIDAVNAKNGAGQVKVPKTENKAVNQKETGKTGIFDPIGLSHIKSVLKRKGIPFEVEWRFHKKRRFRFDIAILHFKMAIEYEGIFAGKSRHTSLKGYTTDCEKYNIAIINGWHVFRYTALNYKDFESNLIEFLLNYNYNNREVN